MSPSASHLHETATSFLAAFTNLSATDHIALRSPTCTHIFAPSSLSMQPKTNAQFSAHLTNNLVPILAHFPVTAKEIHVNEARRQVTIWASGVPEFREEVKDGEAAEWEYVGEYIFILDVDEEGRVERVLEFLDSLATERLRGLVVRARKNLGKEGNAW
jgi:ketosteroid isomerase-like protein